MKVTSDEVYWAAVDALYRRWESGDPRIVWQQPNRRLSQVTDTEVVLRNGSGKLATYKRSWLER